MEVPLVNKEYLLKKFPGKGGWIYAGGSITIIITVVLIFLYRFIMLL